ncbi:MAG: pyrroline-5-carboxylate reductase [Christensenellaceae bacterium]|jgi:pyrroline-5-carboxylate reductase|nr:pyrroline-5-carboxylate reductase [Christensenellaceae bacterium]
MDFRLGFIGVGNMGRAIIGGVVAGDKEAALAAYDVSPAALDAIKKDFGVLCFQSGKELCAWADLLLLAVKPQMVSGVLAELKPFLAGKALVSIVAGLSVAKLRAQIPETARVLRVMPNTPAMVGQGMSALCDGSDLFAEEKAFIGDVFAGVGRVAWLPERLMDAVTAVSGSGPAYAYLFIEAMAEAGVREGLPFALAKELAAQTLLGAAQMVLSDETHPAQLRAFVTSPAGTTAEGVAALERGGVRAAIGEAVHAAAKKSVALGG